MSRFRKRRCPDSGVKAEDQTDRLKDKQMGVAAALRHNRSAPPLWQQSPSRGCQR